MICIYSVCKHVDYVACLYTDPVVWSKLQERFTRRGDSDSIRDIFDGTEYKNHLDFLSHPGNISLTLNTDGINVFRSSCVSLWPIWLVINELPPSTR